MTDDLATRLKASHQAQEAAQDLLDAGQAILKAGNDLFADVNSMDAFAATTAAVNAANIALLDFMDAIRFEPRHD